MKRLICIALLAGAAFTQTNQPRVVAPDQIKTVSGTGKTLVTSTGAATAGDSVIIDANGNHVDSGSPAGMVQVATVLVNATASISATTLFTTPSDANHTYMVAGSAFCTAVTSGGTVTVQASYTDVGGAAQTAVAGLTATCTTLGAASRTSYPVAFLNIQPKASTAFQYTTTVVNAPAPYQFAIAAYQVN